MVPTHCGVDAGVLASRMPGCRRQSTVPARLAALDSISAAGPGRRRRRRCIYRRARRRIYSGRGRGDTGGEGGVSWTPRPQTPRVCVCVCDVSY